MYKRQISGVGCRPTILPLRTAMLWFSRIAWSSVAGIIQRACITRSTSGWFSLGLIAAPVEVIRAAIITNIAVKQELDIKPYFCVRLRGICGSIDQFYRSAIATLRTAERTAERTAPGALG